MNDFEKKKLVTITERGNISFNKFIFTNMFPQKNY